MRNNLPSVPPIALGFLLLAGCGGSAPVALPDTADGTAKTVIAQLLAGNARVLWDAMPAGYQKDVGDLVHLFGGKMDAEILAAAAGAVDKAVGLMESKKEWILEFMQEFVRDEADRKNLASHWEALTGLVKAIAGSELRSAAKLKTLDVGSFLGAAGSDILKRIKAISPLLPDDPFAQMAKLSFKAGEAKDGVVSVQVVKEGGDHGRPEKFQQVEGRWLPADMAKDWPKMMAEARQGVEGMDLSKGKAETLKGIAEIGEMLGKLAAAKDKDEFKKQMTEGMGGLESLGRLLPFGR